MSETRLDKAHGAMQAAPEDDAARVAFYGALADAELFVLLSEEPGEPGAISPEILDIEGDRFALVFDSEERLTAFAKAPAPYAALPGRVIAGMLAGREIGLGLNLGVAPSSILIPGEAMDWLMAALAEAPEPGQSAVVAFLPPDESALALLPALRDKLTTAGAMRARAWLARARFADDSEGALLGLSGIPEASHEVLARAAQEALVFSGQEGALTTIFLTPGSRSEAELAAQGREIPLPPPPAPNIPAPPPPPGSDPNKPPILK